MYEPLLQIIIPDHHVSQIDSPARSATGNVRKVIVIAQAWAEARAELNTVAITEHLLRSGKIDLIALGDFSLDTQFPRDPVTTSRQEHKARLEQAKAALQTGEISVANYLSSAFRRVPIVGVNDDEMLTQAYAGRNNCLGALVNLCGLGIENLSLLGEELGISPSDRWFLPVLEKLFDEKSPETIFSNRSEVPIPILDCLQKRLEALKKRAVYSKIQKAENLFNKVDEKVKNLPALLKFAAESRIDLDLYQNLVNMEAAIEIEGLNIWQLSKEREWLLKAIIERLFGGKIDPHGGLKALFKVYVRRALQGDEQKHALLHSNRPLHHSAEFALLEIVEAAARDMEQNDSKKSNSVRRLLDLAAIFGLNDRRYGLLRKYLFLADVLNSSMKNYSSELRRLKDELVYTIADEEPEQGIELYELGCRLSDLERLAYENFDVENAKRILAYHQPASYIVECLESLGVEITDEEKAQAKIYDDECLPPALAYCESCLRLPGIMADGVLRAMARYNAQASVLLCGGFHTGEVVRELSVTEQVACSVITPEIYHKEENSHNLDPKEVLEQARSSIETGMRLNIHFIHGIRHMLNNLQKEKGDGEESSDGSDKSSSSNNDFNLSTVSGGQEWAAQQRKKIQIEEALIQFSGEINGNSLQECRVCYRRAPVERNNLICSGGYTPDVVLECQRCERFICAWCAGRKSVVLLPGHVPSNSGGGSWSAEILICNIHGFPLGTSGRRFLSGGFPGHSFFK